MYAIIETGGKQYKVAKDSVIEIERLAPEAKSEIVFNDVLLVGKNDTVMVGEPLVKGAKVTAELLRDFKSQKTISFKFRRRKNSKSRKGHRQLLSRVRIKEITLG